MKRISVILPCHNEEKNLPLLIPEISKNIPRKYTYEIICVDDGSTDSTAATIAVLSRKNKNIKGIIFYKNFGHQQALMAGIKKANGDAIIMMDSDFQHPPAIIKKFIEHWEGGFDLIQAKKTDDRTANPLMRLQRKIGYRIWQIVSEGALTPGISDFRLISKEIADYVLSLNENQIFLRGVVSLAAKRTKTIPYKVGKRKFGRSSYTLKMFLDMFANGFISFSTRPLRLATILGVLIFVFLAIFITFDIARAIITGKKIIEGWVTGVILTIAVNSILMIYLGILGEYIGTIFKEIKRRPPYLISKKINIR